MYLISIAYWICVTLVNAYPQGPSDDFNSIAIALGFSADSNEMNLFEDGIALGADTTDSSACIPEVSMDYDGDAEGERIHRRQVSCPAQVQDSDSHDGPP